MARYQVHQIDGNQAEIIEALEVSGCSVVSLGRPVDLAVGVNGRTYLFEIKQPKGQLRKSQEKFIGTWRGHVGILRSVDEALAWVADAKRQG